MSKSIARAVPTLLLLTGLASAQVNFNGLGTTDTFVTGLSHDGTAIAGYHGSGGTFRWTVATGVQSLGGYGAEIDISNGGGAVCGNYLDGLGNENAGRWTQATGWVNLGGLGGISGSSVSSGTGISADGNTVVGMAWISAGTANACKWTAAGGLVSLGSIAFSSRALDISADGSTPVGWDTAPGGGIRKACKFTPAGIVQIPGTSVSEAHAANQDASAVVGVSAKRGFLWTQAGGFVDLGAYPGSGSFDNTVGMGVSDDGTTVVGMKQPNLASKAWIWRASMGLVDMHSYLSGLGANVAGWDLRAATGISGDGNVIVGWGVNPLGQIEGWRLDLGPAPQVYCVPKLTSVGCTPSIAWQGTPSASASNGFLVRCEQVINNKNGLLFYGVNGRAGLPYQGAFLCVAPQVKRTPSTNSQGNPPPNDCSGVFQIDMNSFASGALGGNPLAALSVAGTTVNCQWWGRDPGFLAPNNTQLSNGLEYVVQP